MPNKPIRGRLPAATVGADNLTGAGDRVNRYRYAVAIDGRPGVSVFSQSRDGNIRDEQEFIRREISQLFSSDGGQD